MLKNLCLSLSHWYSPAFGGNGAPVREIRCRTGTGFGSFVYFPAHHLKTPQHQFFPQSGEGGSSAFLTAIGLRLPMSAGGARRFDNCAWFEIGFTFRLSDYDVGSSYVIRFEKMCEYAAMVNAASGVILPELTVFHYGSMNDPVLNGIAADRRTMDTRMVFGRLLRAAYASPHVFRHRGKVVISSYMADVLPPEKWKKLLDDARKENGNDF